MEKGRGVIAAALAAGCVLVVGATEGAPQAQDALPKGPAAILEEAFDHRYGIDFTSTVELVMRNRSGQELRRRFQTVSKVIEGRVHSMGRLIWPEYLRGMTILTIEAENRGHDAFLYLPSLDKVRRVSTAQRGDAFLGSDVTYEDMERQHAADFDVGAMVEEAWAGESVYRIEARPIKNYNYAAVTFLVAASDRAILAARYFKRDQSEAYRVIKAPRSHIVAREGHLFPGRLEVENLARGTTTEVEFRELEINPVIDDRIFSVSALEQERRIPGSEANEVNDR